MEGDAAPVRVDPDLDLTADIVDIADTVDTPGTGWLKGTEGKPPEINSFSMTERELGAVSSSRVKEDINSYSGLVVMSTVVLRQWYITRSKNAKRNWV